MLLVILFCEDLQTVAKWHLYFLWIFTENIIDEERLWTWLNLTLLDTKATWSCRLGATMTWSDLAEMQPSLDCKSTMPDINSLNDIGVVGLVDRSPQPSSVNTTNFLKCTKFRKYWNIYWGLLCFCRTSYTDRLFVTPNTTNSNTYHLKYHSGYRLGLM